MSIYQIAAFIGVGYILKDKIGNTSTRYSRSNPVKDKVYQIITDKLDLIFYGNCLWRPVMSGKTLYGYGNTTRRYYPVKDNYPIVDIYFNTKFEAENVLDNLREQIERYNFVSVEDYYHMCGTIGKFTDRYYGWEDLDDAKIDYKNGRYHLILTATERQGDLNA